MIEPEPLQQIERTYVRFRGRKLSYFSGCDYFRLASHPKVKAALEAGLKKFGLNVAASRLTTGNHILYRQLERAVADFFQAEAATVVSSGYLTNLVAAQALTGNFSHVLIDEKAHPSLVDAARFLDCPVVEFRHLDSEAVAQAVRRCGAESRLILLTDGMFASNGSAAPLREYLQVLPKDAMMLVDDAHAAGVLGRRGKGSLEHAGVSRRRMVQTITLSKAFGAYGGAILTNGQIRNRILQRSRMFAGSTPLPLPLASAALAGIKALRTDKSLRERLARNTVYVKSKLREAGFRLPEAPGPIISIERNARQCSRLSRQLLAAGIYPPFVRYPGGPASGHFRFVISSEHSVEQLDDLLNVFIRD